MRSALISIIIPIYKVEKYLRRCIDSAINQTYRNMQIIMVDDGSPDNCGKICDDYAKKDSRITVIHQKNQGLSAARNSGIQISEGEYIYFLDSDDYINCDLIEKAYSAMAINNAELVVFNSNTLNEEYQILNSTNFYTGSWIIESEKKRFEYIIGFFLGYKHGFSVWNKLYKAEIIKRNCIKFKGTEIVYAEDIEFNLNYIVECKKIIAISDCLYNYLTRNDSIMNTYGKSVKLNEINTLSKSLYDYIVKKHYEKLKNDFYMIHLLLIMNEFERTMLTNKSGYFKKYVKKLDNIEFYNEQFSRVFKNFSSMKEMFGLKISTKHYIMAIYLRYNIRPIFMLYSFSLKIKKVLLNKKL